MSRKMVRQDKWFNDSAAGQMLMGWENLGRNKKRRVDKSAECRRVRARGLVEKRKTRR